MKTRVANLGHTICEKRDYTSTNKRKSFPYALTLPEITVNLLPPPTPKDFKKFYHEIINIHLDTKLGKYPKITNYERSNPRLDQWTSATRSYGTDSP